ncbi:hypothetical protein ASG73_15570 [Janibacter sp. Soil728]|nr:hypothetical protein ASG73_15570 [Janibacter sp. Soil728]
MSELQGLLEDSTQFLVSRSSEESSADLVHALLGIALLWSLLALRHHPTIMNQVRRSDDDFAAATADILVVVQIDRSFEL